jgi:hypothetical protein
MQYTLKTTESVFGVKMLIYTECLQKAWKNFRCVFPTPKQVKKVSCQYMTKNSLQGTAQQRDDLNPLDFYLRGHLKTLVHSAPIENEETLYQLFLMPLQPIANAPGLLK